MEYGTGCTTCHPSHDMTQHRTYHITKCIFFEYAFAHTYTYTSCTALQLSTPILILHLPLHLPNGHLLLPFLLLILKRQILPYPKHGTIRTSRGTAITHRPHIPTDLLRTSVHTRFTYHMTLPAPIPPRDTSLALALIF